MSLRRRRLSTHTFAARARAAARHYEGLRKSAKIPGDAGYHGRKALAHLNIGLDDAILVERAKYEKARWVVIAS